MRDDSLRNRYEEMRNGVEQIRAEEQRQGNASRGKETQVEAETRVAKAKQSILERKEILQ